MDRKLKTLVTLGLALLAGGASAGPAMATHTETCVYDVLTGEPRVCQALPDVLPDDFLSNVPFVNGGCVYSPLTGQPVREGTGVGDVSVYAESCGGFNDSGDYETPVHVKPYI